MNFVICKRNRLQTYLLTNLIINLMVLVDKENVKGYVQMDEKEHTNKEYASKGLICKMASKYYVSYCR